MARDNNFCKQSSSMLTTFRYVKAQGMKREKNVNVLVVGVVRSVDCILWIIKETTVCVLL